MSVEIKKAKGMFPHAVHPDHLCLCNTQSNEANTFDALIERRWCTAITPPKVIKRDDDIPWDEYHDDDEDLQLIPK